MKRILNILLLFVFLINAGQNYLFAERQKLPKITKKEIAESQLQKAKGFFEHCDYDSTMFYLENALELYRNATDKINTVSVLSAISKVFIAQGQYGKAKIYSNEGLFLLENYKEQKRIDLYINLAAISTYELNYATAKEYFDKAYKGFAALEDSMVKARYYYELGNYFVQCEGLDSAYKQLIIAEKIFLKENALTELSKTYTLLGMVFFKKNEFSIAEKYFNKAIKIGQNFDNHHLLIQPQSIKGMILLAKGDAGAAVKLFESVAAIACQASSQQAALRSLRNYQILSVYNKNFVLAEKYTDSLLDVERKMMKSDASFDIEEKHPAYETSDESVDMQISKVKVIVFATVIIALVILPFIVIKRIKRNKKRNE